MLCRAEDTSSKSLNFNELLPAFKTRTFETILPQVIQQVLRLHTFCISRLALGLRKGLRVSSVRQEEIRTITYGQGAALINMHGVQSRHITK